MPAILTSMVLTIAGLATGVALVGVFNQFALLFIFPIGLALTALLGNPLGGYAAMTIYVLVLGLLIRGFGVLSFRGAFLLGTLVPTIPIYLHSLARF